MSQNNSEEISVQQVFNKISNYLKNEKLFERLLSILHEDRNFKCLLKTGEKQFFDAPSPIEPDIATESMRLCYAKLNYLAVEVDQGIDKIVEEKFQGEFLNKLKDEVLQAILLLSSGEMESSDVASNIPAFLDKSVKEEENIIPSPTKKIRSNGVQNGSDSLKKTSNITNGLAQPVLETRLDIDDGDADLSLFSFDSVSSVHTSDLSSFEDEISLSSNEEFGSKRRLSLKEIQEKLEKSKYDEMDSEEDKQTTSNQTKKAQSNHSVNNNESSNISQKSRRRRKPNNKYINNDDMVSPFKKKAVAKASGSSRSVCGDAPPRRGRSARKHST